MCVHRSITSPRTGVRAAHETRRPRREYCEACILNGKSAIAFVEGRPWSAAWVTPYVRLGAGYSRLAGSMKSRDFGNRHEDIATLLGEIGVDVHHGWASARLFAFHLVLPGTSFDREPFNALGVQLGARL